MKLTHKKSKILQMLRLVVIITLTFGGIFGFGYQSYLNKYYVQNAPKTPNASTEEIYEVTEHYTKFYLTMINRIIYVTLLPFGGVSIILAFLLADVWKT